LLTLAFVREADIERGQIGAIPGPRMAAPGVNRPPNPFYEADIGSGESWIKRSLR